MKKYAKYVLFTVILTGIFALNVMLAACGTTPSPISIKIAVRPDDVNYDMGEFFDATGMVVEATYPNGEVKEILDYVIVGGDPILKDDTYVTVTYGELSARISIAVTSGGNMKIYAVDNVEPLIDSPLSGKTLFFLGSSVTYGSASGGESMAEFIAKRNSCTTVKRAVSGTTLANGSDKSYVARLDEFDKNAKADAFILQLSTNDTKLNVKRGAISSSYNIADLDATTTYGAIEYIIATVKETWNCPIIIYSNSYYENEAYASMVSATKMIANKWGITFLNLYEDEEFNSINLEDRRLYMNDSIHPTKAGYLLWWTPKFEKCLYSVVGAK